MLTDKRILRETFANLKEITIHLLLCRNTFECLQIFQVRGGQGQEILDALENVTYEGGTDIQAVREGAKLFQENSPPINFGFWFSDGISTIGSEGFLAEPLPFPLYTFTSSEKANFSTLQLLAKQR